MRHSIVPCSPDGVDIPGIIFVEVSARSDTFSGFNHVSFNASHERRCQAKGLRCGIIASDEFGD